MKKVLNTQTNMKKVPTSKVGQEKKQHYTISIRPKGKGFDARMTLKVLDDGKSPRITAYGSTQDESIYRIFDKMEKLLKEYKKMGVLNNHLSLKIYDAVLSSVQKLQVSNTEVLQKVSSVLSILTEETDNQAEIIQSTSAPILGAKEKKQQVNDFINTHKEKPQVKSFYDLGIEWFEYEKTLLVETPTNPKPLSPKTVEGYRNILFNQLIPYFIKNENIVLITEENLNECVLSFNGFRNKEGAYVVLKMLFDFARENKYIQYRLTVKKPQKPHQDDVEELLCIDIDRQNIWLDKFEQENTDVSLLFETMLLTGLRPEEACGLKWSAINFETDIIKVNNAFKDIPVYNDAGKVIGHIRRDDRLKSPESYRVIPLNPRLKKMLLAHRDKQQELYKIYNMKWNEKCYCFLNRYRQPYVSENLSDCMQRFYGKYSLEYMTPYGLRHSFATFCSENGMEQIVLMKLMGHSDFNTTLKYYIYVSNRRKIKAMAQVYKESYGENAKT